MPPLPCTTLTANNGNGGGPHSRDGPAKFVLEIWCSNILHWSGGLRRTNCTGGHCVMGRRRHCTVYASALSVFVTPWRTSCHTNMRHGKTTSKRCKTSWEKSTIWTCFGPRDCKSVPFEIRSRARNGTKKSRANDSRGLRNTGQRCWARNLCGRRGGRLCLPEIWQRKALFNASGCGRRF